MPLLLEEVKYPSIGGEMKGLYGKYFVLNPNKLDEYGRASRIAIMHYAKAILGTNPKLANDLRGWITHIRNENSIMVEDDGGLIA